jgi:ABC-type amino acid transport substrate-binding protein
MAFVVQREEIRPSRVPGAERTADRRRGRVGRAAWLVGVLALIAPGPSRAADAPAPSAAPPKEIRVGVTPNYPPLIFKEDGQLRGLEADFARQLGEDTGAKIVFVELPWEEEIPALEKNKIDVVMSGVSVTEDRAARVAFVTPYAEVGQMALIRNADLGKLSDPEAMSTPGRKIGVVRGTTGAGYAQQQLKQAEIITFDSSDAGIAALRGGQIDFFIHDAPTIWRTVGRPGEPDPELVGLYRPLTQESLAWAVRKSDRDTLGSLLDAELARWKENGKLRSLLTYWVPVRRVTPPTPEG